VDAMIKKANQRLFFVRGMLRARFCNTDIIAFYMASIRSVLEYGSPVWHFSISLELSQKIENIQRRVIKMVDGIPHSNHWYDYEGILVKYKLKTLEERRNDLCRDYITKISSENEHQLHNMLPKQKKTHGMSLRTEKKFVPPRCKTARYQNTFIPSAVSKLL
jgi:hypothetical protein